MRAVLFVSCATLVWRVFAQAAALPDETAFLSELPVVLSVSRLAQAQADAPAAVSVIDRDMIRASGLRTLPDLLRLVPGFNVAQASGNFAVVAYHGGMYGGFPRGMQVLVDGASVYNPMRGSVSWNTLPVALDDIERIEVTRGPNAATYGMNAFQAVINIITRHAAASQGWHVALTAGEKSLREQTLRYGGSHGDLRYRMTLLNRGDTGLDSLSDTTRDSFVSLRGDYRLNTQDELTAQLGWATSSMGEGEAGLKTYPPHDTRSRNGFAQLVWRRTLDTDTEWRVQAYHLQGRIDDRYTLTGTDPIYPIPVDRGVETSRDSIELQVSGRPLDSVRVVWGGEIRRDTAYAPGLFNTRQRYAGDIYRVFGNAEWRLHPQWLLNAGAMLEKHFYAQSQLSPRVALNYQFLPQHTLRLGLARASRSPTFFEQNANDSIYKGATLIDQLYAPGRNLQTESLVSREIGYLGEWREQGVSLDVRLFRDGYSDIISTVRVTQPPGTEYPGIGNNKIFPFMNAYDVRNYGAEYQLRWRPLRNTWLLLNQAWVTVRSTGKEISRSSPSNNLSLLLSHQFGPGWQASLGYYKVNAMTWPEEGDPVKAYGRVDVRLAKSWRVAGNPELALVVQNLNAPYAEFRPDNVFDRRAYATLSLDW